MLPIAPLVLAAAASAAPAPTPLPTLAPAMLKVAMPSFTAKQTQIRVRVDQPFQIRMDVTSGTGYSWQPQGPLSPGMALLGVFQHPSAKVLPGGPGQEILVFRAHDVGSERLTLQYARAWERAAKPAKVAAFTVTVHK